MLLRLGRRSVNWLARQQAEELLSAPDTTTLKGLRDCAILKALIDAWSRAAGLNAGHVLRPMNKGDKVIGLQTTSQAIWRVVSKYTRQVEMEAAALYAFAQVKTKDVVCFAHITNQMAQIDGDFEKGLDQGSHDTLQVIALAVSCWTELK